MTTKFGRNFKNIMFLYFFPITDNLQYYNYKCFPNGKRRFHWIHDGSTLILSLSERFRLAGRHRHTKPTHSSSCPHAHRCDWFCSRSSAASSQRRQTTYHMFQGCDFTTYYATLPWTLVRRLKRQQHSITSKSQSTWEEFMSRTDQLFSHFLKHSDDFYAVILCVLLSTMLLHANQIRFGIGDSARWANNRPPCTHVTISV